MKRDAKIDSRKDAALLAQLRSGHCLKLAHYQNRIDPTKSPTCPRCLLEDETVKHWINCPALTQKRLNSYGRIDVDLGALTKEPERSLVYAKATLMC